MRRIAPLALLLLVSACGDKYTPVNLYQATTPDCRNWADESTFVLPEGITVGATAPTPLPDGGVEIGLVYMLPRGTQIQFTSRSFKIGEPKGPAIMTAEVASIYQRGTNQRAEIVEVLEKVPVMMAAVATSDATQFRYRLQFKGKLPQRFDFTPPTMVIKRERYPVRTFTYRYFEDRKTYGMCT
ncbi:hypothetical protein [Pseudoduganella namucuonensis]|uniref:Lipoprotein n=1 Tax=Pseudoduganella namucuonensis TaxID=1035707 RepID=A0A1I7G8Y1_9BURK|nr:hypothetical protein [Pseudoduganella namucuonensis]SFU44873.1 hypothetical protein SAMN05216552_1003148 [Pseudoduganella namucuonensis]